MRSCGLAMAADQRASRFHQISMSRCFRLYVASPHLVFTVTLPSLRLCRIDKESGQDFSMHVSICLHFLALFFWIQFKWVQAMQVPLSAGTFNKFQTMTSLPKVLCFVMSWAFISTFSQIQIQSRRVSQLAQLRFKLP